MWDVAKPLRFASPNGIKNEIVGNVANKQKTNKIVSYIHSEIFLDFFKFNLNFLNSFIIKIIKIKFAFQKWSKFKKFQFSAILITFFALINYLIF